MIALEEKNAAAAALEAKRAQSLVLAAAAGVPEPPTGEDYDSDEEVRRFICFRHSSCTQRAGVRCTHWRGQQTRRTSQ